MKNEKNYEESIPFFPVNNDKTEDNYENIDDGVTTTRRRLTGVSLLMLGLILLLVVVVVTAITMAPTFITGSFLSFSVSSEQHNQPTHQLNEQQQLLIQTVQEVDSDTMGDVAFKMEGSGNSDFDGAFGLYTESSYVDPDNDDEDYIYKEYFKLNNNDGTTNALLLTKQTHPTVYIYAYDYGPDTVMEWIMHDSISGCSLYSQKNFLVADNKYPIDYVKPSLSLPWSIADASIYCGQSKTHIPHTVVYNNV